MVLIGIAVLLAIGGFFLCCIKPRGDVGYKMHDTPLLPLDTTPTRPQFVSPPRPHHHIREPVTGSWSPGDPSQVGLPLPVLPGASLVLYGLHYPARACAGGVK